MNELNPNHLGSLYREIRTRRNLPIKLVQGALSQSSISHFELSCTNARLQTVLCILPPTYMTPSEFFQLSGAHTSKFDEVMSDISKAYNLT